MSPLKPLTFRGVSCKSNKRLGPEYTPRAACDNCKPALPPPAVNAIAFEFPVDRAPESDLRQATSGTT